jgi:hypothetical protein
MNPRSLVLWARCIAGRAEDKPAQQPAPGPPQGPPQGEEGEKSLPLRVLWESGKPAGLRRVRPGAGAGGWPARTDILCWHCCHNFDTAPIPMPVAYDDRKDVFTVTGIFCSFQCLKAHNVEGRGGGYLKSINAVVITAFRKRCTGVLCPIKMAPPRVMLKAFGGTMTIEEFRAAGETHAFRSIPPRMVIMEHVFEQQARAAALANSQKPAFAPSASVDFKDATASNETLKLKRPKPMQKDRNVLERTMGINVMLAKVT